MSIISEAYAQTATTQAQIAEPNALLNLLPLILIFAVFYVFLIRPQQKKIKEHQEIINAIKRGDEVVTGGGIIGKVSKIEEGTNLAHVEIADGVIVRINKATIIDVIKNDKTEVKEPKAKTEKKSKKANS